MGRNRKQYSDSFKNKVVVELLKSGRRQEELVAEYGIFPSTCFFYYSRKTCK